MFINLIGCTSGDLKGQTPNHKGTCSSFLFGFLWTIGLRPRYQVLLVQVLSTNCLSIHLFSSYIHSQVSLSVIAFVTKPLNFQPPQKVMQQFFLGYSGPYFGPTNTNHIKNYQKITFGALFRITPPKCTTVYYSAVQWIEVKALELFTPDGSNMTHNDPG